MRLALSTHNWIRSNNIQEWLNECSNLGFEYLEVTDTFLAPDKIKIIKKSPLKPISIHLNRTEHYNLDVGIEAKKFDEEIRKVLEIANKLNVEFVSIKPGSFRENEKKAESNLKINLKSMPEEFEMLVTLNSDQHQNQLLGNIRSVQNFFESFNGKILMDTSCVGTYHVPISRFLLLFEKHIRAFHVSDYVSRPGLRKMIVGTGDLDWSGFFAALKNLEARNSANYPLIINLNKNYNHYECYLSKNHIEKITGM